MPRHQDLFIAGPDSDLAAVETCLAALAVLHHVMLAQVGKGRTASDELGVIETPEGTAKHLFATAACGSDQASWSG